MYIYIRYPSLVLNQGTCPSKPTDDHHTTYHEHTTSGPYPVPYPKQRLP